MRYLLILLVLVGCSSCLDIFTEKDKGNPTVDRLNKCAEKCGTPYLVKAFDPECVCKEEKKESK